MIELPVKMTVREFKERKYGDVLPLTDSQWEALGNGHNIEYCGTTNADMRLDDDDAWWIISIDEDGWLFLGGPENSDGSEVTKAGLESGDDDVGGGLYMTTRGEILIEPPVGFEPARVRMVEGGWDHPFLKTDTAQAVQPSGGPEKVITLPEYGHAFWLQPIRGQEGGYGNHGNEGDLITCPLDNDGCFRLDGRCDNYEDARVDDGHGRSAKPLPPPAVVDAVVRRLQKNARD